MIRLLNTLVVAGTVLAVVGCGKARSPKAAFEQFVAAAKGGNEDKMVACMDKDTGSAMKEVLALMKDMGADKKKNPMDEFKGTFSYGEQKIDGDKATLEVTKDGKTQTIAFTKEDGAWKISIPELQQGVKMLKGFKAMADAMGKGGK